MYIFTEEHKRKLSEAKRGKPSGALGKTWKLSEESKKNHSIALKGKRLGVKLTAQHRANISKGISGERNPMKNLEVRKKFSEMMKGANGPGWRGGVSTENELARRSMEYRIWREAVFKRDNWTCQICSARGIKVQADHIKPFAYFLELRYSVDNGRTLCIPCHKKTPTYGMNGKPAIKYLSDLTTS